MTVKINNLNKIKEKLGIEGDGKTKAYLTNTCYKHMDKYVPMREGNLRTNVSITPSTITYESVYAAPQYYGIVNGYPVQNYTTPGTGPYWDKRMISAEMGDVVKEVQAYIDRGGK